MGAQILIVDRLDIETHIKNHHHRMIMYKRSTCRKKRYYWEEKGGRLVGKTTQYKHKQLKLHLHIGTGNDAILNSGSGSVIDPSS